MENRLQNPLNPLGVDLVDYIWIGKLGFETPTVFGWGKGPGLIRVHTSCKIFASGHKEPSHPIRIASVQMHYYKVLFMKQRLQKPISAITGLQA